MLDTAASTEEALGEHVVKGHIAAVSELKGKKGKKGNLLVEFKYCGGTCVQLVVEQSCEDIQIGQAAIVALEGATLPTGCKVQRRKVAGEWSEGALIRLCPFVQPACSQKDTGDCDEDALEALDCEDAEDVRPAFGFDSVREAYDELGAAGFYAKEGKNYHNPHEPILGELLGRALDAWESEGYLSDSPPGDDSIDAAPSSEPMPATSSSTCSSGRSIRLRRILDLACGSGEASEALLAWASGRPGIAERVEAADPYTYEAYERRTGRQAHRWTFEDIAAGDVLEGVSSYDMVLCSFCLHLLDKSWLHGTLTALARASRLLLVATPHKRPFIEASMGWTQLGEVLHDRVRVRLYRSLLL